MFSQACVKNSVHRGGCIPACTGADIPPPGRQTSPGKQTSPPPTATAADGTHHTGMLSCLRLIWDMFWTYLGLVWDMFGDVLDMIRFTVPSVLLTLYILLQPQSNFRLSSSQQTPVGACIY